MIYDLDNTACYIFGKLETNYIFLHDTDSSYSSMSNTRRHVEKQKKAVLLTICATSVPEQLCNDQTRHGRYRTCRGSVSTIAGFLSPGVKRAQKLEKPSPVHMYDWWDGQGGRSCLSSAFTSGGRAVEQRGWLK